MAASSSVRSFPPTLIAIVTAVAGVALMFASAVGGGDLLGNTLALGVAILFGANTVVARAARGVDLVPATVLAGLLALMSTLPLAKLNAPLAFDFVLLAAMGCLRLGLGLFLFMRGAPHLTAVKVSLLEIILAPIWVWLAFAELPAPLSLVGGAVPPTVGSSNHGSIALCSKAARAQRMILAGWCQLEAGSSLVGGKKLDTSPSRLRAASVLQN